ncbi:hypothetical protein [Phenylobacterium sp.]|uniref:hypothetical protein n=1 Tax=Phenylobacterium sp. TaxID=1871053 RepID=UPI003784C527
MRPGPSALLFCLPLLACAQADAPQTPPLALDCGRSFEAQVAAVTAQPLTKAPGDPAEPYDYYSTADGKASYLVTRDGAPGHPAIMMQQVRGGEVVTTGCPYGDKAGYEQLHAYLDSLKSWRRKSPA